MPKIMFVNEHREVEVESGRLISEVATELGIITCRVTFANTNIGDYTVWVDGAGGCVSKPTWYERVIKRCTGQRRMANRTRVLGDCKVWTQPGMASRARVPRPIAPAPRAGEDGSPRFDHEHNPAGTAYNPYGHPHAVASGTRDAPVYVPPVKKKRVPKKKAAPQPEPKVASNADTAAEQ
ncbi:MAG TPA: hypothetical protein ENK23_02065 [Sorangium sp.]|nr:hypothetical protein [Sorangium sp.]